MSEKKEIQAAKTGLSNWSNAVLARVSDDYSMHEIIFDEDQKRCARSAMESMYMLMTESGNDPGAFRLDNLQSMVEQCASLKLDSNAFPKECYFQIRNKKIGNDWVPTIEMGIEGPGHEAMLRNFGAGVKTVHPKWVIKEGDDFSFGKRKGLEVEPPSWEEKGLSNKVVRVVIPIEMQNGNVLYESCDRNGVKVNLAAHIRNNLLNETFGICKDRYKATDKEKEQIAVKKAEIMDQVNAYSKDDKKTLDDMLSLEAARPYISMAWLDSTESMVTRKMINNVVRKFPKNMNSISRRSMMQSDEIYQAAQEEITDNENVETFTADDIEVVDADAEA